MSIVFFEKTSYLSAVQERDNLNTESKLFKHTKANLQFTYVDVNAKQFAKKYSDSGWFGRKVIALPEALCSGILKTIYHLAKAIMIGSFQSIL